MLQYQKTASFNNGYRKVLFCTMLLLCPIFYVRAATVTSTNTGGNWNDGTTWTGGSKPGSADDVVIAPNAVVLMDAANVTAGILSLMVSSGSSLQISPSAANNIRFNIKGNIINNGTINFWLSSTQGVNLYLTGSTSTWSGAGSWNLAQLSISNSALEFSSDLSISINRTISIGTGSLNAGNKRSGITFTLAGTENATIASETTSIFYGNIIADKNNKTTTFAQSGTADAYNLINILGDITINPNNRLTVGSYNILEIKNNLSGSGRIVGGTSSDIQITGNGAAILFNSGGSGFRNFTVTRPSGITVDSTLSITQMLSLQNQCKLYLPAGKSANGNQTFSIGQSTTAGAITGDGYLAQQAWSYVYQLADVTINGTAADVNLRFSQIGTENVIHDLTVNKSAGNINLLDGGSLQVRNTLTITNGNFKIGSGTLKLTGTIKTSLNGTLSGSPDANLYIGNDAVSSAATIYFNQDAPANRSLKTYTQVRNGTITLGNTLDIYGSIDLNSTSSANILKTANNLTLISNEAGTARVNNLGSALITDSVIVQRFIKGSDISRRSYRLLSSPVYQGNATNSSLRRFYFSRLQDQILITGNGGTSKGFDPSPVNGPTIWKYNEPAANSTLQDFIPISSISKSHANTDQDFLTSGNGFLLFFRGDRINNVANKTTAPFSVPEDATISYKGLLNQGNITVTAPYGAATGLLSYTNKNETNDGFNLVGNPYPSAIDWELSGGNGSAIGLTNINPTIYILDPVTKNYGTYTKGGISTGSATQYIASGQGFFVKANGINPTLTFTEAAKATDISNPVVLGEKMPLAIDFLRINLQKDSLNQDDILLTFKDGQSEDYQQEEDVEDLSGMSASVSLSALSKPQKKQLAVNALPLAKQVSKIPLFVDAAEDGNYQLKLTDLSDSFKNVPIFLKDNFTKDSINLRLHPEYAFFIRKNNAATFGNDRFEIYFQHEPVVAASLTDNTSRPQSNLPDSAAVILFPNPTTSEINFLIGKRSTGNIKLNIYNNNGMKIHSSLHQNQLSFKHNVARLTPGVYIAELTDVTLGSTIKTIKFIKK